MPIKKIGNKYKYGDSGKLYVSKKKALEQMRAMYANGYKEKETHKGK